jgi:hypothetical protein
MDTSFVSGLLRGAAERFARELGDGDAAGASPRVAP